MSSQIFLQVWVLGCVGSTVGYLCKYGYQGVFEVGYFYRYGYRAVWCKIEYFCRYGYLDVLNCKVGHFWRYGYHYQGALTPKLDIYAGMGLRMFTVSDIFADSRVGHFCRYGYEGEFTVQVRHFCRFGN